MSLLFAPFPITPAPIGVRGAFAAATSTTIHETDVLDEAWAKLKAVGASIGEAFDSVLASIKATATTSASDPMEMKNHHDDDYATDEVSTPSDGASPTKANVDPTIDYGEDDDEVIAILEGDSDDLPILEDEDEDEDLPILQEEDEDEDEDFPILEGDNEDTPMLEDNDVFDACDELQAKCVFATAARGLASAIRWLAALLPKPKFSKTAAAKASTKATHTEWIGSEKFEMLASDDEDDDEDEDLLIEWIGSEKFEMLVYDEYEDEDWPSEDEE